MRLSKFSAFVVLLATLAPLVYLFAFMAFMVRMMLARQAPDWMNDDGIIVLFAVHFCCVVWIWGLIAFYLVFVFKAKTIPKDFRVLWAVLIIFVNVPTMLVFWFLYVWPSASASFDDADRHE